MTAYATVQQLIETLGKESAETTDVLDRCLAAATASINLVTGRRFDQVTETRTFDGSGIPRLFVVDLLSVSALNYTYPSATPELVDPTLYALGPAARSPGWPYQWVEQPGGWFPQGSRLVSITGIWGWPAVPDDIAMTCISIAARLWKASKSGFSDLVGVDATGELQFSKALTTLDRMVLEGYKRRFIV